MLPGCAELSVGFTSSTNNVLIHVGTYQAAKEREHLKGAKTKIKFQITAAKHLPKMDRFGKTDCYCVTLLDNKPFGGQRYRRKSKIIKKSLNPEWENEVYVFDVVNFPEQEVKIGVWDWDAGDDDDEIGNCAVSLSCIRHQERSEQTLTVLGDDGNPVTGNDGSYSIVKVVVERGTAVDDVKLSMHALVGDDEEVRVLDLSDPPWESAVRGLMFDINNTSPHPVMITGMQACAGRAKGGGSCSYTIYRAPGKWNIGRCPARDHKCFRCCCFLCPCCCCKTCGWHDDHRCMRLCCRCTPCTDTHLGGCCCGECGPAVEKEEPCCDGCKPCCTGNCAICWLGVLFAVPLTFPFGACCCCGWYVGRAHGGGGGCPALSVQPCCSYECCRNGVHRQADMCEACAPACRGNCTCNATCCYCCRHKFFDRRRWTRVTAGWANLPTDWGELAPLPSLQHFEGGGVLIPPGKTYAFYIHAPHPETKNGEAAIGIRGPHKRGFRQGDVCGADEFIQIRTGPYTMHPLPFPNSDPLNSARDGQYYDLEAEHLKVPARFPLSFAICCLAKSALVCLSEAGSCAASPARPVTRPAPGHAPRPSGAGAVAWR